LKGNGGKNKHPTRGGEDLGRGEPTMMGVDLSNKGKRQGAGVFETSGDNTAGGKRKEVGRGLVSVRKGI